MSDYIPDFDDYGDTQTTSSPVQGPPHNRSAEEAVLGSVLLDPEVYYDLTQILGADDFYIRRNGTIWLAFQALAEEKAPIDLLTVSDTLAKTRQLEDIGGVGYLSSLINQTPTTLNARHYGRIVHDNAIRRRMILAANQLAKLAVDEEQTIDTVLNEAEKSIFSLSEKRIQRDLTPLNMILSKVYDQVEALANRDTEITGVPTGLNYLDRWLGGLQKSDLLIVAGRPGMGKTGFMLTAAKNAAIIHKKTVAYFSLEMSNEQLAQRMLAQETNIDMKMIRTGRLKEDDWDRFVFAINNMTDARLFLDDTPGITPLQLRTKCRRLHMEFNLDLIVIDYLQLMQSERRNENRVQEVSHISRNLKMLARELNVPVLAAAQLSRAVEQRTDKRPVLSDLRESGSLEQDADIVLFIHRPSADDPSDERFKMAEIIVAKHRNGPTHAGIELLFKPESASFDNLPSSTEER
ncbi:MAG: replicative DNA helicase [Anaerolineae bacterium]|jgi:replicative DNA helicase|nr:replicative DNA helicase [Anaerolineae bacterium]